MKYAQDQIDALKTHSCLDYLLSRGHKPKSSMGRTHKFLCPWRPEKSPSLHVYKASNTWADFSDRSGGSIIQLVMRFEGVSFGKACEILLDGKLPSGNIEEFEIAEDPIKIVSIGPITSPWLLQYLSKRCIPAEVANQHCKQLRIELKGDNGPYRKTVIGMQSGKGGWEMRNSKTKISNSPKYFTVINPTKYTVIVFEGFMDCLSYFTLYGYQDEYSYLILNSASFSVYVPWGDYRHVLYYGDADVSGTKVLGQIQEQTEVTDMRFKYHPYKDLNAYLMSIKSCQSLYDNEIKRML